MNRRLKRPIAYGLYASAFIALVAAIVFLGYSAKKENPAVNVSKQTIDEDTEVKVVNNEPVVTRPYQDEGVKIVKNFYDYKADEQTQENSLILYKDTYIPSTGVAYSSGKPFNVIAILDGTVTEVKEDDTLGNSVMIEHKNGTTSVYQSISDISVKKGDTVTKGQIIAKSSTSDVRADLDNHLYFELIIDGKCVNPENYYDKTI